MTNVQSSKDSRKRGFAMPEFARPATYIDKLLFAQRVVKGATYRSDQKLAIRELCEGITELVAALLDREEGREVRPGGDQPEQKPAT
jgi:hypothetical protein